MYSVTIGVISVMKYPRSCAEYYTRYGYKESGVFKVDILFNGKIKQIEVYCDMVNYGGGWLVRFTKIVPIWKTDDDDDADVIMPIMLFLFMRMITVMVMKKI